MLLWMLPLFKWGLMLIEWRMGVGFPICNIWLQMGTASLCTWQLGQLPRKLSKWVSLQLLSQLSHSLKTLTIISKLFIVLCASSWNVLAIGESYRRAMITLTGEEIIGKTIFKVFTWLDSSHCISSVVLKENRSAVWLKSFFPYHCSYSIFLSF